MFVATDYQYVGKQTCVHAGIVNCGDTGYRITVRATLASVCVMHWSVFERSVHLECPIVIHSFH